MKINLTIKFYLNLRKRRNCSDFPIYARVILDREKFELSTKQFVNKPELWDEVAQRVRLRTPINSVLNDIEHEIREAFNTLKYSNRVVSINALRMQLKNKRPPKMKLKDYLAEYYEKYVLENRDYRDTTKKNYKATINHLKRFIGFTQNNNVRLLEVDRNFIREFDYFLSSTDTVTHIKLRRNSINKYHVKFKTILLKAIELNLLSENPYQGFKLKDEPGRLTFLTSEELKKMENHSLGINPSLIRVRDIFLFSVYTGLRYSDAISLRGDNIENDGGDYWINYTQRKTGVPNRIPMLNRAASIFDKYEPERKINGYVLPRFSNQKINSYLKVIAEMVGIEKTLSHHVARHTAATTIFLQNGVSMEVTSKQLGHTSLKSTQIYAKITNLMLRKSADHLNKIL